MAVDGVESFQEAVGRPVGVVDSMENEKFVLLLDILKILEKHNNPETMQSVFDIIDSYDGNLSQEQKAALLKEFLHFRRGSDAFEKRMEEESQRENMRTFIRTEYI